MTSAGSPNESVLKAFGVHQPPCLLDGGQGQTWASGDIVVKPVDDPAEADCVANVMNDIQETGFRVSRPVRSTNDRWIEQGWVAWSRVEGEHHLHGGRGLKC